MESGLLLNVVIGESPAILELLAGEDEPLLVRRNPLFVLDLGLHVVDRVGALHLQGDRLPGQRLDEDLHSSPQAQHKVERGFLLDVIIGQGAAVLQLLAGEDEPLLVRGDPFLVLDLRLHVVDRVGALHLQGDRLPGQSLDEDLHAAAETEDEVESRLLLDVVIRQGAPVLELLSGEDQPLLVRWNPFLVLDLSLDVVDRVGALHLESDGLAGQSFHKDLHVGRLRLGASVSKLNIFFVSFFFLLV